MNPIDEFKKARAERIQSFASDATMKPLARSWIEASMTRYYTYNYEWLGRPIIQYPEDVFAMQELVFAVRPDLIIETGIAHGGSIILSASLLTLMEYCEAARSGNVVDPSKPQSKVIGIDIDIRKHNRDAIEQHPMASRIELIEGSSVADDTVAKVRKAAEGYKRVIVCLDSMHTHDHVLAELKAYAPMTTVGSYCVVFDTFVEDMPPGYFKDRPWDVGNNPKTAVWEYLKGAKNFEIDRDMEAKLQITGAPDGYLKRIG